MVVDLHVIPREGKWALRAGDSRRDNSLHDSQEQALREAHKHALEWGGSIIVYAEDGSVLEQHTLPPDSVPEPDRQKGSAGRGGSPA